MAQRAKRKAKQSKKEERHRTAHCWECGEPLDSLEDEICLECGWVVCPICGACGCEY